MKILENFILTIGVITMVTAFMVGSFYFIELIIQLLAYFFGYGV